MCSNRLARLSFSDEIGPEDCKKYLQYRFEVPPQADLLVLSLAYEPHVVEGARNLITMSLFDPHGFRGASHRSGPAQHVEIGSFSATPGYLAGPVPEGTWILELETHWIHPASRCRVALVIDVLGTSAGSQELALAPAEADHTVNPSPGWYRGDLHTHTDHSDGAIDVRSLLSMGKEHGLDFLALTDHNTISGLKEFIQSPVPGLLAIPGMELTTFWGHALALGIDEWIDWRTGHLGRQMAQNVEETVRRSGVFIIAHPIDVDDAMCTGCRWRYEDLMPGKAHGVEVWNGPWSDYGNEQSLHLWYEWLNRGSRIPATAGSDCHARESRSLQELRVGLSVVNARSLSRSAILEGVRRGRLYLSSGPEVLLFGRSEAGQRVPMGESVPGANWGLEMQWRRCPGGSTFQLIADGGVAERFQATTEGERTWSLPSPAAHWCLVELRDAQGQMLALTNPVYVGG